VKFDLQEQWVGRFEVATIPQGNSIVKCTFVEGKVELLKQECSKST